jgi:hypothetical protein
MKKLLALVLALPLVANARGVADTIGNYESFTTNTLKSPRGDNDPRKTIEGCDELAKEDGTPHAKAVCAEFAKWSRLVVVRHALDTALGALEWLKEIDPETNHESNGKHLADKAKACRDALATARAQGLPEDVELLVSSRGDLKVTLARADAELCTPLADAADKFAGEVTAAKKARFDRIAKPYKAAGIGGERLELLVEHDGIQFYGAGKVELSSPSKLAHAKVLFELGHDDTSWTIIRYELRGDKLVSTTTQTFDREPNGKAFR